MARPAHSVERIPELSEVQKAWLAGFLDGEGHLAVQQTVVRSNGRRYYVPILQVAQAGDEGIRLLQVIQADLGWVGTLQMRPAKDNARASATLMLYGKMVQHICRLLLPYLRLKHPQAEILASWPYRKITGAGRGKGTLVDPEGEVRQIELFERIRALNARGTTKNAEA